MARHPYLRATWLQPCGHACMRIKVSFVTFSAYMYLFSSPFLRLNPPSTHTLFLSFLLFPAILLFFGDSSARDSGNRPIDQVDSERTTYSICNVVVREKSDRTETESSTVIQRLAKMLEYLPHNAFTAAAKSISTPLYLLGHLHGD